MTDRELEALVAGLIVSRQFNEEEAAEFLAALKAKDPERIVRAVQAVLTRLKREYG